MKMKKHWRRRNLFYRGYMLSKALFSNIYFGFPSRGITCLGITGTDGKSTTSYMTYWILKKANYKVGLLSTVYIDVGMGKENNLTKLTSLSHWDFCKYMKKAKRNGMTHMIIEVSSHSLYQFRIWPTKFDAVGFTNLTREHLDFHRTMKHYFRTKATLFTKYAKKNAVGVCPDKFSKKQKKHLNRKNNIHFVSFGNTSSADIFANSYKENPHLSVNIHYKEKILVLETKLLGQFNAENMMIAIVLSEYMGTGLQKIESALLSFPGLPGRQELVISEKGVTAMIDFALTPEALETLYKSVNRMGYERIIAVFGATGDRDQGKRPLMGKIATRLCDYVIITEDENYNEDGLKIIEQIESGIDNDYRKKYCVVKDRESAIKYSLQYANPRDIIIVTGMANFTTRSMNKGKIPWNERAVIEKYMKSL